MTVSDMYCLYLTQNASRSVLLLFCAALRRIVQFANDFQFALALAPSLEALAMIYHAGHDRMASAPCPAPRRGWLAPIPVGPRVALLLGSSLAFDLGFNRFGAICVALHWRAAAAVLCTHMYVGAIAQLARAWCTAQPHTARRVSVCVSKVRRTAPHVPPQPRPSATTNNKTSKQTTKTKRNNHFLCVWR